MFALSMKTGRIVWSHGVGAGTESSPLVHGNNVYFGDQAGTVYSLRIGDGHVNWTYHASAAVKGGPAFSDGNIYFGDYAGRAYALNAASGHQVWAVSTSGTQFGFGSGNFYSTPAVAFGRVYMGNTDSRVYSFAAHTGAVGLGDGDRRLRLRLPRCGRRGRPGTHRLPRLLRRQFLRLRRPLGRGPLAPSGRRAYLGLGHDRRQRRLLLRPRRPQHRGTRPPDRAPGVLVSRRRVQSGHRRRESHLSERLLDAVPDAPQEAPDRSGPVPGETGVPGRPCYHDPSMRCRSGSHCQQPAVSGRRFCADHAAELDRMREELKDAAAARIGRGRPKRSSTCCRPGCYEPRVPPAAYCDACAAAGYVEEAA